MSGSQESAAGPSAPARYPRATLPTGRGLRVSAHPKAPATRPRAARDRDPVRYRRVQYGRPARPIAATVYVSLCRAGPRREERVQDRTVLMFGARYASPGRRNVTRRARHGPEPRADPRWTPPCARIRRPASSCPRCCQRDRRGIARRVVLSSAGRRSGATAASRDRALVRSLIGSCSAGPV